MMTSPTVCQPWHFTRCTELSRRPLHGAHSISLVMTESNNTCGDASDDIWGIVHPRDVRLQIYMSFALGLGAFLTFCVS